MNRFILLIHIVFLSFSTSAALPDPQRFSVVLELGDVVQARQWLDEGLDPNFEGHLIGTGLMIGAWEGHIQLMELFIARGADINRSNRHGETALMLAAWKNRREAMRWLLERGAQANRPDREWTALHYATFGGHADLAEDLLKAGADVNARSTNGSTVVMMAAREGHTALAKRLIAAGANPAIKNDFEEDAVAWAMKQGNYDIAKSFTSAGNFAELTRNAANFRAPVRSIPVPNAVDDYLRMANIAESNGLRDQALAAYRKAMATLKTQQTTAGKASPGDSRNLQGSPNALMISAKRASPDQQSIGFVTADRSRSPAASSSVNMAVVELSKNINELLESARQAENDGKRRKATRLYELAAEKSAEKIRLMGQQP